MTFLESLSTNQLIAGAFFCAGKFFGFLSCVSLGLVGIDKAFFPVAVVAGSLWAAGLVGAVVFCIKHIKSKKPA